MPNVIALTTEYAPRRVRTAIVSFVFCGYSVGALAAALSSRSLLPVVGWEPIFWLAGIPLLFIPFLIKDIPESVVFFSFEVEKRKRKRKVLLKIDQNLQGDIEFGGITANGKGSPITGLFQEKRAFSTVMFWVSCFSAFVLIYSMNTWLPRLMMEVGYDLSSSLLFTAVMQIGAIVGTLVFGPLVSKLGFKKVLVPLFFCGALALALIGFTSSVLIGFALIAVIGAASVGVQNISNAFVSQYYSASMRSTAIGSTMAFGRLGGIAAPLFIGVLLSIGLQPQYNFAAIASAAVLGGVAMLFVQEKHGQHKSVTVQSKQL